MTIAAITYQRPEGISRLLASIALLEPPSPGWTCDGIVVVDNDPEGSARSAVADNLPSAAYIEEHTPGISAARNRAVAAARDAGSSWIAFVDDDETVRVDWLRELTAAAEATDSVALVGGVEFHYPPDIPSWFLGLRVFESQRLVDAIPDNYFATNNCLICIDPYPVPPPLFAPEFGISGGSDHHLGRRIQASGGSIGYAPLAITDETLLSARMSGRSALKRLTRNGNVMVRVERAIADEFDGSEAAARAKGTFAGAARVGYGLVKALLGLRHGREGFAGGIRTSFVGLGQLSAGLNFTVREYRRDVDT